MNVLGNEGIDDSMKVIMVRSERVLLESASTRATVVPNTDPTLTEREAILSDQRSLAWGTVDIYGATGERHLVRIFPWV